MNLLNKFSIKARLLTLIWCPLALASLFVINEAKESIHSVNQLNILTFRIKTLAELIEVNEAFYKIRIQKLQGEPTEQSLSYFSYTLDQLTRLVPSSLNAQQSSGMSDLLTSLDRAQDEFSDLTLDDISEWSDWVSELLSQFLLDLEKDQLDIQDEYIKNNLYVLYQLQWLLFWANEENWYIRLILQNDDVDNHQHYHNQLASLVERQQFYIERFLTVSAEQEQIELLQKTFSDQVFFDSYVLRNIIINRDFNENKQGYDLSPFDKRLKHIREVVFQVSKRFTLKIQENIQQAKKLIIAYIAFVILSLVIISSLGSSLVRRILGNLKKIIGTLEKIENENDYTIKVKVDGNDEFTAFAGKLNNLIGERHLNETRILKARDEAEQANRAKSSFLANMSHEIRTPLNGVIGMSDVLASTKLSAMQKDYLNTIETSSQSLLILINDILDLSKIESGHLELSMHKGYLREILYDTIAVIIPKATEKNLSIDINIPPDLPDALLLDEHRLRQILMNLMSNAVKFTPAGSVLLTVKFDMLTDSRISLYASVKDTGIGISKDKQQAIFEPFIQEDGSITREFGGTGLGLVISNELVKLMGGEIQLDSVKGKGCNFYFSVDLDIAEEKSVRVIEEDPAVTVILITNDAGCSDRIINECRWCGIQIHHIFSSMLDFEGDRNGSYLFLYCQKTVALSLKDIAHMTALDIHHSFILCQSHTDEKYDFDNKISGLITFPLLGNRFRETVNGVMKEHKRQIPEKGIKNNTIIDIDLNDIDEFDLESQVILVVEDNLINQKVASLILKQHGYDSVISNNGQEAVDAITSGNKYKAILMDCMMPVMDGFTATEQIRSWEKAKNISPLPIIALTASVLEQDIRRCFESGMDDYVAKPFKKEVLIEKIEKLSVA